MKTIVAVLVLALLALADARTILNKSVAKATSVAVADEDSYASSDSHAHAADGSLAVSNAAAIALEESKAFATADADADDGSTAKADALALASEWSLATADADADAYYWSDASADAVAVATNDGYAESTADADAVYEAKADASSTASADGGEAKAVSKAEANNGKATSVAKAESEETHHYYPGCYDDVCDDDDNDDGKDYYYPGYYYGYKDPKAGGNEAEHYYPYYFDPYYYKYAHYTYSYPYYHDPAVEGGNEATVKYYGYYIPHPKVEEEKEEEVTTVKLIDPAIIEYYAHKVYDFGCYEGKFYRCTYDDSCGTCPYGHFCGTVKKNVCKAVTVWVKKCDAPTLEPAKKCRPVLTPCGKGFCKYNEKCATDYSWCGGKWCEPKYTCVAVAQPKKCVWVIISDEYGFEKKVEKCEDYKVEACAAGTAPCPIGYECSADPCTFVETTVKKCEDEDVPVCLPYDLPTYGDLYSACGPAYCHPGYKCESFEHKTCAPRVIAVDPKVIHVYHPIFGGAGDNDDDDCDDCHHLIPYGVSKSSAQATATAVGFKKVDPIVEVKKVDPKVVHVYHPIVGGAGDNDDGDCDDDCHHLIPYLPIVDDTGDHDDDDCDDDDCHHLIPYLPIFDDAGDHDDGDCDDDDCHHLIPYAVHKSNAKATATAVSTSHATSEESYTNVVLSASGSGSASGSADASTDNTSAWSKGKANKDVDAKIWTGSKAYDNGKAVATGTATYEEEDD